MLFKRVKIISILLICIFICTSNINAQITLPVYLEVSFYNKNNTPYSVSNPQEFLSDKAIKKKQKYNIPVKKEDLPVDPVFINTLKTTGAKYLFSSKWFNSALFVITDSAQITQIDNYPFVRKTKYLGLANSNLYKSSDIDTFNYDYGTADLQTKILGLKSLHAADYNGQGVAVAVFDAGFYKLNEAEAFQHLFDEGRLKYHYDLVEKEKDVFDDHTHGQYVMSTMAAYLKHEFKGTAIKADYYLFRTENGFSEYPVEEYFWLVAAEKSDSIGIDVINSSLGYSTFDDSTLNYTQADMNGQTSIIARAADLAFEKGILVVTSAGNEGNSNWRIITSPGDAEYAITVGAINRSMELASFSSVGNTSDGRIKPDLVAIGEGTAITNHEDVLYYGNGTSFSSPTLAGAVACLRQKFPDKSNIEIRSALMHSASQFINPDSLLGNGIPNFYIASQILTDSVIEASDIVDINPNPFSSFIYLKFKEEGLERVLVRIYNIQGDLVSKKIITNININEIYEYSFDERLRSGLYFMEISHNYGITFKKLVKF